MADRSLIAAWLRKIYVAWQERRDRRCEPLARQRDDLYDRLNRIHAAALSDADLAQLPALRDFLIRESSAAPLPGAIIGLLPEGARDA